MKLIVFPLLLASLLLTSSFLADAIAPAPAPTSAAGGICDAKCKVRCSRSGWYKRCYQLCCICCSKCKYCVPSGPRADKAECPCYRDMLNPKGKPKCP